MQNSDISIKLIGETIRNLRKQKGFSQEKLAELAQLHPKYLGQVEIGNKTASLSTFLKVCYGLEIEPSDFFLLIEAKNDRASSRRNIIEMLDSLKSAEDIDSVAIILSEILKLSS